MKAFVIAIEWYGPYSRSELSDAACRGRFRTGMYLARGFNNVSNRHDLQYVGISKKNYMYRVKENHDKLDRIIDPQMYGGIITYNNAPEQSRLVDSILFQKSLDYVETVLAYVLQPPMNDAKVFHLPQEPAIIINRWFSGLDLATRQIRGDEAVPDYLEYDPAQGARMGWIETAPRFELLRPEQLTARARRKQISN